MVTRLTHGLGFQRCFGGFQAVGLGEEGDLAGAAAGVHHHQSQAVEYPSFFFVYFVFLVAQSFVT